MSNKNSTGFFEGILTFMGIVAGGTIGYEQGDVTGLFVGAILLGILGKWIGAAADFVFQIILLMLFFLLSSTIRQFLFEVVSTLIN